MFCVSRTLRSLIIYLLLLGHESRRVFPDKVIGAYGSWQQCDDMMLQAASYGANVLLWFSINLSVDKVTGLPKVTGGPDYNCVANITKTLKMLNISTIHMISVGGWNSPHPDTSNDPKQVYRAWKYWNEVTISNPLFDFHGFDGIDWDIEGNDDVSSTSNYFTVDCLDLIGQFSQLAKDDGYFVSLAPAQSYLDSSISSFDRFVNHTDPQWDLIVPNFTYHGRNVYAYLLAKYGITKCSREDLLSCSSTPTFDMISIQLYEGYSHANYNVTQLLQSFDTYLENFVEEVGQGWFVDFEVDSSTNVVSQIISVPSSRLVIGLANGWAANSYGKFLYVSIDSIESGYNALLKKDNAPKGFMYWDVGDDNTLVNGTSVNMAKELNKILRIRP